MFDALLQTSSVASKLTPDSLMFVLKAVAVKKDWFSYTALLQAPCAVQLSPETAFEALYTLVTLGHTITPACQHTPWAKTLSAEQVVTLIEVALQHNNIRDISSLCAPAASAKQLSTDFVLQLAFQLLHG